MTILLDTNVVLDILLDRQPWYNEAALIFGAPERIPSTLNSHGPPRFGGYAA
ncbi:MAG: PIN domain-containing protein [Spirochaetaceae bacterium]|nr:PIN domain-containing protein [Spirochaetaceae bacterium]